MQSTTRTTSRDKTGWSGEDLMFVKEINDFCRDKLYPKEKFLQKNWQEYLPNDRRSLYSVWMKLLSIPNGSDKREIWSRVIVPSIREHEVQYEQQNQVHIPEYEFFFEFSNFVVWLCQVQIMMLPTVCRCPHFPTNEGPFLINNNMSPHIN